MSEPLVVRKKYCPDCRWCKVIAGFGVISDPWCSHSEARKLTGAIFNLEEMRSDLGVCGPTGVLYEPKAFANEPPVSTPRDDKMRFVHSSWGRLIRRWVL